MRRLQSILGYGWATLTLAIVLATFLGNSYFSQRLVAATGVSVSPWFSGGEIANVIEHGAYRTYVYRPVFDGLFGERSEGFIQIDWKPAATLPGVITESIALAGGEPLSIRLDTQTGIANLASQGAGVLGLERTYRLKDGWAARVRLHRLQSQGAQ